MTDYPEFKTGGIVEFSETPRGFNNREPCYIITPAMLERMGKIEDWKRAQEALHRAITNTGLTGEEFKDKIVKSIADRAPSGDFTVELMPGNPDRNEVIFKVMPSKKEESND